MKPAVLSHTIYLKQNEQTVALYGRNSKISAAKGRLGLWRNG